VHKNPPWICLVYSEQVRPTLFIYLSWTLSFVKLNLPWVLSGVGGGSHFLEREIDK